MGLDGRVDYLKRYPNRRAAVPFLRRPAEENSMSAHPPPIPPDQRPKAGPKDDGKTSVAGSSSTGSPDGNLAEQGQAGNTKQNTTNKGLQQDR
jgi:hypothetical protein